MNVENETFVKEFLLVGHISLLHYPKLLFMLLLIIYIMSQVGNSLIITIVKLDSRLHTPMYFFLCNLSLVEIIYTSVTFPTILGVALERTKWISVPGCLAQIYFLHFIGVVECLLLTIMAYDRYAAICRPLHYSIVMNRTVCMSLAGICWLSGFLNSMAVIIMTSRLPFCGPKTIMNFFCDIPQLLKLACADTTVNEALLTLAGVLIGLLPCLFIVITYIWVVSAIVKIPSTQGRWKAFSTCASHVIVVSIFFGTLLFMYMRPTPLDSSDQDQLVSLMYTVLTPMLNPLIYSLRNNEVKEALKKVLTSKYHHNI
ncbi:olfactory receptor 2G6-like [Microcaecilia unicolor]|uniref:Olfactory receptor n=1 Tax=Microcaecilia unicolor TaxID=1415580 RepID=A0A6P7XCK6_9AMPH|nr:olfactory receptor 2G6-like [Microcaecilia unicolor]